MRVLCLRLTSVYTVLLLTINMLCGVGELLIQNGGRDTQFTTIADLMACSRVRRRSQSVCERHQTSIRELSTSLLKGHMPKTVLNRKRLGHDTQICNGPGLTMRNKPFPSFWNLFSVLLLMMVLLFCGAWEINPQPHTCHTITAPPRNICLYVYVYTCMYMQVCV